MPVLENMFHFCGEIKGKPWEFGVQRPGYFEGVAWTVKKIGVAKGDVLRARRRLLPNVGQDRFRG
ncbi:MAG: hypothetical protein M5U34_31630 [Chloroflexi bacterium]|nr:hypothetical protein [Chloroflexota bacterium]